MISVTQRGSFKNTERYLARLRANNLSKILTRYGALGVQALSSATPVDSGETASSWFYTIQNRKGYYSIRWHNQHEEDGVPIAVILQYGHGTRQGGYVQGRDYINPAMQPIFDQILRDVMEEVTKV